MFDYITHIRTDIGALVLLDTTFAGVLTCMVAFLLFSCATLLLFSLSISARPSSALSLFQIH